METKPRSKALRPSQGSPMPAGATGHPGSTPPLLRGKALAKTVYVPSRTRGDPSVPGVKKYPPVPHLASPTRRKWERRRDWYESVEKDACSQSGWAVSEHGCALADAVGAAFCAGAWLAAIRLALDVVDAWPAGRWSAGTTLAQAHPATAPAARPAWERARRKIGDLVHLGLDSPQGDVDEHWRDPALEEEAREAIQLMFQCLYPLPRPAAIAGAYRSHALPLFAPPA